MKNLKINSTAIEFLKINKVRLQSLAAAVVVAGSLTGCAKDSAPVTDSSALGDKYINNSYVITNDAGEKNVVKIIRKTTCNDRHNPDHYHYFDVVTQSYYSDSDKCIEYSNELRAPVFVINVTNVESIFDYLTKEEISKLMKNELSEDDCAEIIFRIKESKIEEVKTK